MEDVLALFETEYFRNGLRLGIIALAAGWALRLVLGRHRPPLPIGGLLIAAGTMGALYMTEEDLRPALPALGVIAVAVLVVRLLKLPVWVQLLASVPGAVWLAFGSTVTDLPWVRFLMAILIPVGGFLITDFETRYQRLGLGVVYFTLAVLGAFAAVPDTEQVLALVAVALPVTLLAWPKVAASIGPEGAYLAVATLLWVTAAGGGGRPPSIAGSAACLGFLLIEPVLVRLRPVLAHLGDRMRQNWLGPVVASVPQFVLVVICSRIAARFTVMIPVLLIIAAAYAIAIGLGIYVAARQPEPAGDTFTDIVG